MEEQALELQIIEDVLFLEKTWQVQIHNEELQRRNEISKTKSSLLIACQHPQEKYHLFL